MESPDGMTGEGEGPASLKGELAESLALRSLRDPPLGEEDRVDVPTTLDGSWLMAENTK